jgi:hypothetical protein
MNDDLGIAQKCTGCAHRVDEGLEPRCVDVCPHEAITFGEVKDTSQLETYLAEAGAEPRVYWNGLPKPWIAGQVIDGDEVIEGVSVTAVDLAGDGSVGVLSDAFGDFWLMGLKQGRKYRVEIRMDGYEDFNADVVTDADQDLGTVVLKAK